MTNLGSLAEGLAIMAIVGGLIWLGLFLSPIVLARVRSSAGPRVPLTSVPPAWRTITDRDVPFVQLLSAEEQERLFGLIHVFLREKTFQGCAGLQVTEEMKITIAAQACLLLLNLGGECYPNVQIVLVYPSTFVPKLALRTAGQVVPPLVPELGESWQDGSVVLAWDSVLSGARDITDGRNVTLHEFAHQLDQEDGESGGVPILDSPSALRAWGRVFRARFEELGERAAKDEPTVLDSYGATNRAEFFAVATETFFEKPLELQREYPDLYEELKRYYHQDPAARLSRGRPPA